MTIHVKKKDLNVLDFYDRPQTDSLRPLSWKDKAFNQRNKKKVKRVKGRNEERVWTVDDVGNDASAVLSKQLLSLCRPQALAMRKSPKTMMPDTVCKECVSAIPPTDSISTMARKSEFSVTR